MVKKWSVSPSSSSFVLSLLLISDGDDLGDDDGNNSVGVVETSGTFCVLVEKQGALLRIPKHLDSIIFERGEAILCAVA